MKKIAVITYYKDNFGSILQAYSTYNFLKENDASPVIVNRINRISKFTKIKNIFVNAYRTIRYRDFLKKKVKQKKERNFVLKSLSQNTKELMDKFVNDRFEIVDILNEKLNDFEKDYDKFIVGSDQVWNVSSNFDDFFFLGFTQKRKKIALSPSFGTSTVPPCYVNLLKRSLLSFPNLSTREETGVDIIKKLTGKESVRLPDPTVIYNRAEWNSFSRSGIKKENYILLHFLGEPNDVAINTINNYIDQNGCEVVCIVNKYEKYKTLHKYSFLDIDPFDYISLISNANYVFTDSFHSTLFSINLCTNFATFDRQFIHGQSQSSRIIDLLSRCNLSDHYLTNEIGEFSLSVIKDGILDNEREKIRNYLICELSK